MSTSTIVVNVPPSPHKNYHIATLYSSTFNPSIQINIVSDLTEQSLDQLLSQLSISKFNKDQTQLLSLIQSTTDDLLTILSKFNEHLTLRSYLFGDQLSIIDLIFYIYYYNEISTTLNKKQQLSLVYLMRYINHLKLKLNYELGSNSVKLNLGVVKFVYKNLIVAEQQEQLKKQQTTTATTTGTSTPKATTAATAATNSSDELNPNCVELTVGKVISCEDHPEATKLYVEKISITPDDSKILTICSGLKGKIEKDLIRNQLVLLMTNLKPSKMVGIESEGMLLAATNEQDQVELITFNNTTDLKAGDRVIVEGFDVITVDKQIKSDKLGKKILPHICTNEEGVVTWKGQYQWKVLGKEGIRPISNFKKVPVK